MCKYFAVVVQGLCGPRMLSGVFLCNYFAVVCARFMWAQNAQWGFLCVIILLLFMRGCFLVCVCPEGNCLISM